MRTSARFSNLPNFSPTVFAGAFLTLAAVSILISIPARADDRAYGPGGCGLGSVLLGPDGSTVLTMTTNDSSYTQTFAISSGTSNCVDSGVVRRKHEARAFIELNQRQLANDIAKGGGETVTGLAHIYNCQPKAESAFGSALHHHYQTIFPSGTTTPDHIESSIRAVIMVEFNDSCLS